MWMYCERFDVLPQLGVPPWSSVTKAAADLIEYVAPSTVIGGTCGTAASVSTVIERIRSWSCSARLAATARAFSRAEEPLALSMPERTASATKASTVALTMASISAKPDSERELRGDAIVDFIDTSGPRVEWGEDPRRGSPTVAERVGGVLARAHAGLAAGAHEQPGAGALDRVRRAAHGRRIDRHRERLRVGGDDQTAGLAERGLDPRQVRRRRAVEVAVVLVEHLHRRGSGGRGGLGVRVLRLRALREEQREGDGGEDADDQHGDEELGEREAVLRPEPARNTGARHAPR